MINFLLKSSPNLILHSEKLLISNFATNSFCNELIRSTSFDTLTYTTFPKFRADKLEMMRTSLANEQEKDLLKDVPLSLIIFLIYVHLKWTVIPVRLHLHGPVTSQYHSNDTFHTWQLLKSYKIWKTFSSGAHWKEVHFINTLPTALLFTLISK